MSRTSPDDRRSDRDRSDPERSQRPGGGADADAAGEQCRVGVRSPHNSKETKAICNAVRALGHEPVWIRDENVASRIEGGRLRLSPSVDVLVNRTLVTKSDRPLEALQLAALYERRVPVLNPVDAVRTAIHKYLAGATLADAGLPVPDAVYGRSPGTLGAWSDHIEGRAAHKRTVGTNGRDMRIVSDGEAVAARIANGESFVQEYLEGERRPSDVRVYVVDGRIVAAMRRHAPDGEWRTNVALGGKVEDVGDDLAAETRRTALAAVDALGLDVAGVDLFPTDGECYVLEVNATAGFKGLFEATGESAAPYIAGAAVERGGGTVPDGAVADLADDLDDSVPACKPDRSADPGGTLGYTTEVAVGGTDAVERVVAKSDTGAERTSLDTELAGRIGAGPMVGTTEVRSAAGGGTETRPLVEVDLRVGDAWRTVTASVSDRGRMTHQLLLGRDVLTDYTLDVSRTADDDPAPGDRGEE
jgi:RimK family alpha-L-glutamate ligase